MSRRLLVISKSYLDVRLTVAAFEQRLEYEAVEVLVLGSDATVEPLMEAGVPRSAIRVIPLVSEALRLRRLGGYVRALRSEKRLVDRLVREVQIDPATDILFFSYHMSPHVGYFLHQVSKTNRVMFLDAIASAPKELALFQKPRKTFVANLAHYAAITAVFGRIFGISGTPSYSTVHLKPSKCRLSPCGEALRGALTDRRKALYECPAGPGRNAVILYADPFMCDAGVWRSTYEMAFEALIDAGYNVLVKLHPDASRPDFFVDSRVTFLPQLVPFELIHFHQLSLIVGIDGGAMVDRRDTANISLLKLIYPAGASERENIDYLRQNPALCFAESHESFRKLVSEIE